MAEVDSPPALPTEHELLMRVIESPDDDEPRLVFADLLLERNDRRGDLIQVQCLLDRIRSGQSDRDGYFALREREQELLVMLRDAWRKQVVPWAHDAELRRGFIEVVHGDARALLADGGMQILAPIRELELSHCAALLAPSVFALPLMRRLESLTCFAFTTMNGVRNDVRLPLPPQLKTLRLPECRLSGLQGLSQAGALAHVERLVLPASMFIAADEVSVLGRLAAPALREVALSGSPLPVADPRIGLAIEQLITDTGLSVEWRRTLFDQRTASDVTKRPIPTEHMMSVPAEVDARVPWATPSFDTATVVDRELPYSTRVWRVTLDGRPCLLAENDRSESSYPEAFEADAREHLRVPPHPSVLVAESFHREPGRLMLRYEPAEVTALHQLLGRNGEPVPLGVALTLTAQLARGVDHLRQHLHGVGGGTWPASLSTDHVLLDGAHRLRVLPPYRRVIAAEEPSYRSNVVSRVVGIVLEVDAGTASGTLVLLGSVLLELLCGRPLLVPAMRTGVATAQQYLSYMRELRRLREQPLLPSMIDARWADLDEVVRRCFTRVRADQWSSPESLAAALENHPACGTDDDVAAWVTGG